MSSEDATAVVIEELENSGIDYMVVGALSCNPYGVSRATKDADIVVAFDSVGVVEFARRLGKDFRLDRQMRIETITHSIRNVITFEPTGFDIELFRLNTDAHHQERFARRRRQWISELQRETWIPSPEDVVIQKIRWARRKDLDDVETILAVRGQTLDWDYINRWADQHETRTLLDELRASVADLDALTDDDA